MGPRYFLLWGLPLLLSGCFEFHIEALCVKVLWDPSEKTVTLDLVAQNVGPGHFKCEDTAEACAERIKTRVKAGDVMGFDIEGCTTVTETLEQRGETLDVRKVCTMPQDDPNLLELGVFVETEGRPGKEKAHLVLLESDEGTWTDLPKSSARRVLNVLNDQDEIQSQTTWSLKPSVRSAVFLAPLEANVVPLFRAFPSLSSALKAQGLLQAPKDTRTSP
jgi:hypothetical protein